MEKMENENLVSIPFFVHEADMARLERTNKRLFIVVFVLILALIGTNGAWIYYESQFQVDQTTVEQEVDTGNGDAVVVGIGDIYGEGETNCN